MQTTIKQLDPTHIQLTINTDAEKLALIKNTVLAELAKDLKLPGFRKGHAPAGMAEKAIDQQLLQSRVLEEAVNQMYGEAIANEQVRVASSPEVSISKFVPYTTLEITADVAAVGDVELPDYKKFGIKKTVDAVTDDEVEAVLDDLLSRDANKSDVERPARDGDEVAIDFSGVDAVTKKAIDGGSAQDYPLVLGSNTFIPGFEPEIIGLKKGDTKTFAVDFPKNYGVESMRGQKVEFTVSVVSVKERVLPKLDDAFASKVGPFKKVAELRSDIKKQLMVEKDRQARQQHESKVLERLGTMTKVALPDELIDQEIDRMDADEKQNLLYRGQTWQEHLAAEGKTEEEHRESHREQAMLRVKTGIALGGVAEKEKVRVSDEEFAQRMTDLKKQYAADSQMMAELEKPENQRDLLSRILTEKTIAVLVGFTAE